MTRLRVVRTEDVACGTATCDGCRFLLLGAQARNTAGCVLLRKSWRLTPEAIAKNETETINGRDVERLQECLDAEVSA